MPSENLPARWPATDVRPTMSSTSSIRPAPMSLVCASTRRWSRALLGDPGVLLFDEPVNGLDPEGIRWVRHLLRDLASEGRTVLVSSHLINEMALTADRLVVIGRGSLIAETGVDQFVSDNCGESVRIVTPTPQRFVTALTHLGTRPHVDGDGAITVAGMSTAAVGELASAQSLTLHELTPVRATLEDAFMELTSNSVEFRSHDPVAVG